jgi:hypothetical protein
MPVEFFSWFEFFDHTAGTEVIKGALFCTARDRFTLRNSVSFLDSAALRKYSSKGHSPFPPSSTDCLAFGFLVKKR